MVISISKRISFIQKKAHYLWGCLVSQSLLLKPLGLQRTWEITVSLLEIQMCRARKPQAAGSQWWKVVAPKSSTFSLAYPIWLTGKLELEKHIFRFGEQNRLKEIWGLCGPKNAALQPDGQPLLAASCRLGIGWGRHRKKKVFVIFLPVRAEADKAFLQNWEFLGLKHLLCTDTITLDNAVL